MEEVDRIIIHNLRGIGCDIEEDVDTLRQFSTELVVSSVAQCIHIISPELQVPSKLPASMSARFRVGTALAEAMAAIGYHGELGYQTFLYSNEVDVRKCFIFLIEKLPKDTSTAEESKDSSVLLLQKISKAIANQLSRPWLPPILHVLDPRLPKFASCRLSAPLHYNQLTSSGLVKECETYCSTYLKPVCNQLCEGADLGSSIIEENARDRTLNLVDKVNEKVSTVSPRQENQKYERLKERLQTILQDSLRNSNHASNTHVSNGQRSQVHLKKKQSRFANIENLQIKKDNAPAILHEFGAQKVEEQDKRKAMEEEIGGLSAEINKITEISENISKDHVALKETLEQLSEAAQRQAAEEVDMEKQLLFKKKTLDLLPNGAQNLAKLESVVEQSAQRLVTLSNQWEAHRKPLLQEYRDLREQGEDLMLNLKERLNELEDVKQRFRDVVQDARAKDTIHKQLIDDYKKLAKNVNRSSYTKRILEIVANIRKQKLDINKILVDTKSVQKEINLINGKLDRTFTVTDELLFRDARKDESIRKSYKYLASLHENCNLIINTLEETGLIRREIRDIEDQIEHASKSKVEANLEKIEEDYKQITAENQTLLAKFKK